MPTKTVRYRGYAIDIYALDQTEGTVARSSGHPTTSVPIPMPNHASEDEAVKEARGLPIDHILDGGGLEQGGGGGEGGAPIILLGGMNRQTTLDPADQAISTLRQKLQTCNRLDCAGAAGSCERCRSVEVSQRRRQNGSPMDWSRAALIERQSGTGSRNRDTYSPPPS